MNVLQLLKYQIFGSDWISVDPHFRIFPWLDGSGRYNVVLVTEYQYKWMFGGKRWRGTLIGTFRSNNG